MHNAWAQRHAGSALAPRGGVVGDVVKVDPAAVVDRVLEPLGQHLRTGLGIGLVPAHRLRDRARVRVWACGARARVRVRVGA